MNFIRLFLILLIVPIGATTQASTSHLTSDPNIIQPSPFDDWKTIKTDHFNINYQPKHYDFALRMADIAERVHHKFSPIMKWNPHKTEIVINDSVDNSNGGAIPLPYNQFYIYMNAPVEGDLISHAGWIEYVFTHEYTHILHNDQVDGTPATLRGIFGRSAGLFTFFTFPEMFGPHWASEGIAIYNESAKGFGRNQSAVYNAKMRSEVNRGLRDFSEESYEGYYSYRWPFGQVYLYGAYWYQFIEATYGKDKVIEYITIYNSNLIPWRMENRSQKVFGMSSDDIWTKYQAYLHKRFQPQIDKLAPTLTQESRLVDDLYINTDITIGADNSVFYYHNNAVNHPEIRQVSADGTIQSIKALKNVNEMDFHPQGGLLLSKTEFCDNTNQYNDLYTLSPTTGEMKRLTHCTRLPRMVWADDGNSIYAVQMRGGQTRLVKLKANETDPEIQVLSTLGYGEAIGDIDISTNGKTIVASVRREKTGWNLETFDLTNNQWHSLTLSPYKEIKPQFTHDDQAILFIKETSNNQQVELHRLNLKTNQIEQLTSSMGYINGYDEKNGKIYVEEYTDRNIAISQLSDITPIGKPQDNKRDPVNLQALFTTQPDFNPNGYKALFAKLKKQPDANSHIQPPEDYSSLRTLAPVGWMPLLSFNDQNSMVGVNITGQDILKFHQWMLAPVYYTHSDVDKFGGTALYDFYNRFTITAKSDVAVKYGSSSSGSKSGVDSFDDRTHTQALLHYPINHFDYAWDFGIGAAQEKIATTDKQTDAISHSHDNLVGAIIDFNNLDYFKHGISVTNGFGVNLVAETYDALSSDHKGEAITTDIAGFIPLGGKHVFKIAGTYGYGGDDIKPYQLGGSRDLLSTLGGITLLGKRDFALRGMKTDDSLLAGTQMARATLEYRFPIAMIYDGWSTFPLGLGKLHGTVFSDTGDAWSSGESENFYTSAGFEFNFELLIGYDTLNLPISIGYAHGFDDVVGDDQFYLNIGATY